MDNNADLSRMIEKLMSDPAAMDMIQKLKQGALSSDIASSVQTPPPADTAADSGNSDTAKLSAALGPVLNGLRKNMGADSPDVKRRSQLLSALKPYLSPERQNMIDTFTSISGMTGLLDILKSGGDRDNGK